MTKEEMHRRTIERPNSAAEALDRLLKIYKYKVMVLEDMKANGELTPEYGEWSLQHARGTLRDILEATKSIQSHPKGALPPSELRGPTLLRRLDSL